jgi:hypothetical protein
MRRLTAWQALTSTLCLAWNGSVGCSSPTPDEGPTALTGTITWCEVSDVLVAKCQRCHVGEKGLNGAPFPLVTFEDTQAPYGSTGQRRWERMRYMVDEDLMPPVDASFSPPPEKLATGEKALLMTWFDEGAKAVGGTDCR